MLKKEARSIIVSLSKPSKMPGRAWGISPSRCNIGSKLRKVAGSTCSDCYACKGQYRFNNVRKAHEARLTAMQTHPRWIEAMVTLIGSETYFRWHDAGDLQDMAHLEKILDVVRRTPNTAHWMPTREAALIKAYLRDHGSFPSNLVVRLSAAMIDGPAPDVEGCNTSTVHRNKPAQGHECPAYRQKGECGDCRACWNRAVINVSYPKH